MSPLPTGPQTWGSGSQGPSGFSSLWLRVFPRTHICPLMLRYSFLYVCTVTRRSIRALLSLNPFHEIARLYNHSASLTTRQKVLFPLEKKIHPRKLAHREVNDYSPHGVLPLRSILPQSSLIDYVNTESYLRELTLVAWLSARD